MAPARIYLDHAATTPPLPEALAAMTEGFAHWANPSSPHGEGRAARAALEDARARVAAALGWSGEVIFTGGASEALALALGAARVERRVISAVEHDAVVRAAPGAQVMPVVAADAAGGAAVDPEALGAALAQPGRALLAIQAINSETGTLLLPLARNGCVDAVRAAGGLVLADCAQIGPARALPDADMAVLSGHKLGGPVGIGALLVRDFAMLAAAGGQERGYRGGTENLPGALGLAAALEAGPTAWRTSAEQRFAFRHRLFRVSEVLQPGVQCSHIFAVASPRYSAAVLLMRLDAMGFAVSAGSACSSGSLKPSRVLAAFGVPADVAARTIRVSLGWSTTPAELDGFADAWAALHA